MNFHLLMSRTAKRRAALLSVAMAAVIAGPAASPASENAAFDGNWSVSVETKKGLCATGQTYSIRIVDGVLSGGGDPMISGRVSDNGAVTVMVVQGYKKAAGSGRLTDNAGSGRWSGHACSGSWSAARG